VAEPLVATIPAAATAKTSANVRFMTGLLSR
jgi:hypothetical protein